MTKSVICLVFQILSLNFAFAQQNQIDSLLTLLRSARPDTNRVNILTRLAQSHTDLDSAIFYAKEGALLADKIDFPRGQAECLIEMASSYASIGDEIRSLELYQQSLEIFDRIGNDKGVVSALEGNALLYFLQSDYRQELHCHQRAEKIARKINSITQLVYILGNIGKTYLELGQLDSARTILNEAHGLINGTSISTGIKAYIIGQLGMLMTAEGKLAEARTYLHQSLRLFKEDNDEMRIAENYTSLADSYARTNQLDSVLYYAEKALELGRTLHDSLSFIGPASEQLSMYYELKNNHREALRYHKMAKEANDGLNDSERVNKLSALSFREKQRAQELSTAKKDYQNKIFLYSSMGAFATCLIVALGLFYNIKQKQKANSKIEKAYADLKSAQSQLIHSEKMASLGELTAGIAHEIQNPLNFVNNFSEVNTELMGELEEQANNGNLLEVKAIAKSIKENEQKIVHHGKRADAIVKGMLQHSRSNSGVRESTNINTLADEYLRLAFHGLKAKDKSFSATTKTDFDPNVSEIYIIPQEIGRVILNLITNAFYAVTEKKKQIPTFEPTISVSTKRVGNKILVSVKDNGDGIPQPVLNKIFQPFFTTKPAGEGTGLGLSLSYDIVKAHGGELNVKTKEGDGAEFIIELPLSEK